MTETLPPNYYSASRDLQNNGTLNSFYQKSHKTPLASECEFCGVHEGTPHIVRYDGKPTPVKLTRHHPDYDYPEIFVTACRECHNYIGIDEKRERQRKDPNYPLYVLQRKREFQLWVKQWDEKHGTYPVRVSNGEGIKNEV
jgi:hypothetical protein